MLVLYQPSLPESNYIPMSDLHRISKLMSQREICSRREADELISRGWVLVDGQKVETGQKALSNVKITLTNEAKKWLGKKSTVLLYKPVGYVSGQAEDGYKPAWELLLPKAFAGADPPPWSHPRDAKGLAPAGRLDIDSKGLLILTQDGVLAKKVIQKDSTVSKEYIVKVDAPLNNEQLKMLTHGLELDGKKLKKAQIKTLNPTLLNMTLWEGRKRQIRRMCEAVGLKVLSLKRIRIGNLKIGDLKEGQWRLITDEEEQELFAKF